MQYLTEDKHSGYASCICVVYVFVSRIAEALVVTEKN